MKADSTPGSPQKINAPSKATPGLHEIPIRELQDVIFYLADTAHTLYAFLDVYPDGAIVFFEDNFLIRYGPKQFFPPALSCS